MPRSDRLVSGLLRQKGPKNCSGNICKFKKKAFHLTIMQPEPKKGSRISAKNLWSSISHKALSTSSGSEATSPRISAPGKTQSQPAPLTTSPRQRAGSQEVASAATASSLRIDLHSSTPSIHAASSASSTSSAAPPQSPRSSSIFNTIMSSPRRAKSSVVGIFEVRQTINLFKLYSMLMVENLRRKETQR